jgi:hypothetical protein
MTPDQVHYGQTNEIHAARQIALDQAFNDHPERSKPIPGSGSLTRSVQCYFISGMQADAVK